MVSDSNSEFYDHSTLSGKVSMLINRLNWKYIPASLFVVGLVTAAVLTAKSSYGSLFDNPEVQTSTLSSPHVLKSIPQKLYSTPVSEPSTLANEVIKKSSTFPFKANLWNPNKVSPPGTFDSEGCENGLMVFEGFGLIEKTSMKSLKLRDLIIDAPTLSKELEGWTNLEEITIENAWINGEFSRVYLPKLTKFIFHQFHNDNMNAYKLQKNLKSILFFDKIKGQTWDLEKDVLNLNITIQISIGGTKVLRVDSEANEVLINTHFCEDLLKNLEVVFPISTLSLHWCTVTNASIDRIPKDLKYISFNNAVPKSEDLSTLIKSMNQLTEFHAYLPFHCDWPGYEVFLNISELPSTTDTVSLSNLDISFSPGIVSPVKTLSIGKYIPPKVVEEFDKIFVNLKSIAIFNLTASSAYPLLEKVVSTPAEWILVTNLTRLTPSISGRGSQSVRGVEQFLLKAQVSKNATNFLIELVNGTYIGRCVTDFEKHYHRFTRLGFDKIDTYEDYMIWDSVPKLD